jgi:hypothetical protein
MKNTMKKLAAILTVVLTLAVMPAAMMEEIEETVEAAPQIVEEVVVKEEAPATEAVEEKVEEVIEEVVEEIPEIIEETPVVEEIEIEEIEIEEAAEETEEAEETEFVFIYDAAIDGQNIAMLDVNSPIAVYEAAGKSYRISYLNGKCFGYLRKTDLSKMTNYHYVQVVEEAAEEEAIVEANSAETELPANAKLMSVIEDELNSERSVSVYAVYDGETLAFGDTVTLIAVLNGYENTTTTIQWQSSTDNANWSDINGADATTYTFTVTENNYRNFWRVAVTINGVIVADELVEEANAEQAE